MQLVEIGMYQLSSNQAALDEQLSEMFEEAIPDAS
jgi:hypothetical protein